ncbi:RiPP maturation radical SAM C-methyltransferase [bacterium]|nr:RiPP maturation radical SAM C-methyltransferase [bacterium]
MSDTKVRARDAGTLLVNMPLAGQYFPNLAIELLSALARQSECRCEVLYGSAFFHVSYAFGQSVFANAHRDVDICTLAEDLAGMHPNIDQDALFLEALLAIDSANSCIDKCVEAVIQGNYGIVGISVGFDEQKLASLALARQIKKIDPTIRTIFGGTGCDGAMGEAIMRNFPEVDIVAQGDADTWFVPLIKAVSNCEPIDDIGSLLYRDGSTICRSGAVGATRQLDQLPVPNYDSFFTQLASSHHGSYSSQVKVMLEASRGCWWGDRSRCMFCGITSILPGYRQKSPERFLAEFKSVVAASKSTFVFMVDSILPLSYYQSVLPEIARWRRETGLNFSVFFGVRPGLTRQQVALLAAAGVVTVMAGIESLSTRILRLMNKGASMLQQIESLKWATTYGIDCGANLIYGIPNEQVEDYESILSVIPSIHHLQPPRCIRLRYHRFCRYSEAPERYAIGNIRPSEMDRYAYSIPDSELMDLCYDLEYDYLGSNVEDLTAIHKRVRQAVHNWFKDFWQKKQSLSVGTYPEATVITRGSADGIEQIIRLTGLDAQIYALSESVSSIKSIAESCGTSVEIIHEIVSRFVNDGIALEEDGRILALATPRVLDPWVDAGLAAITDRFVCSQDHNSNMQTLLER